MVHDKYDVIYLVCRAGFHEIDPLYFNRPCCPSVLLFYPVDCAMYSVKVVPKMTHCVSSGITRVYKVHIKQRKHAQITVRFRTQLH